MQSDAPATTAISGHEPTVEDLKRELAQRRRREEATAAVLRIISLSPANPKPVFDAIVTSAVRLLGGYTGSLGLIAGDQIEFAAFTTTEPVGDDAPIGYPQSLRSDKGIAHIIHARTTLNISDAYIDPRMSEGGRTAALTRGFRSVAGVPLLRQGEPLGAIVVSRREPGGFTNDEIALVETFADQAVIAIENTRLFEAEQSRTREVEAKSAELTQSLAYQTAISDVLGVIGSSPTDAQPVFDTIVKSAVTLCDALLGAVLRFDGELMHLVAHYNYTPEALEISHRIFPAPPTRAIVGRAILERAIVHIPDADAEPGIQQPTMVRAIGWRSGLFVPMLQHDVPVGVIAVGRATTGRFSDKEIELLKTFADQAVIAIENTRLFEAEQASKRELQESLEYQTATAEVLNVISRSPRDLQPVLENIASTARALCEADHAFVFRAQGDKYHVAAYACDDPEFIQGAIANPVLPDRGSGIGRAILDQQTAHIVDFLADPDFTYQRERLAGRSGTILSVPLIHNDEVVGVIGLGRTAVRAFSQRQQALVETFADQAVIAINNVGLFEEVQARTRELQESLEYQTAAAEVLNVISHSPTDSQPVLDTIAASVRRLTGSTHSAVFLFDGRQIHLAAQAGTDAVAAKILAQSFPQTPGRGGATARALLTKQVAYIPDVLTDDEYRVVDIAKATGYRSIVSVPMLRDSHPVGAITATAANAGEFSKRQIDLLQTFANQAVIAINNAGLFEEVQARNRDLTALGEVGRAVSSTLDLKLVLKTIVDRAVELSGTDGGSVFYFRGDIGRFELGETTGLDEEVIARFRKLDIGAGQTGLGEAIASGKPLQVTDITKRPSNALRDAAIEAGLGAALIVPLLSAEAPLGALVLQRRQPGEFPPAVVALMQSFADQSAIALENARLFDEIAQKSRELEIASQHKSQFVANMSHELRTPLAAILGYAELMQEGFYEPLGQKSLDALTRIRSNGKHLLGLINTVLDVAKIESGQFTLNMAEYAIESVVETVRVATESLAETKNIALMTHVPKSLPVGFGDEQRLTQVLLNLVGNAIKFTDAGEVRITAKAENGHFAVSVVDTGPGIPADQLTRVFEQFHQVDNSNTKKKGGTGLGLAIAKQIVGMHGGRIWVESTVGKGSTFRMELPVRAESRQSAP